MSPDSAPYRRAVTPGRAHAFATTSRTSMFARPPVVRGSSRLGLEDEHRLRSTLSGDRTARRGVACCEHVLPCPAPRIAATHRPCRFIRARGPAGKHLAAQGGVVHLPRSAAFWDDAVERLSLGAAFRPL